MTNSESSHERGVYTNEDEWETGTTSRDSDVSSSIQSSDDATSTDMIINWQQALNCMRYIHHRHQAQDWTQAWTCRDHGQN